MEKSETARNSFVCEKCDYHTSIAKDYNKHLLTRKHLGESPEMEKSEKVRKNFSCEKCNYNTSDIKDYNKHLLTRKHLGNVTEIQKTPEKSEEGHVCDICDKKYCSYSGLWKHRNTHRVKEKKEEEEEEEPAELKNTLTSTFITADMLIKIIQDERKFIIEHLSKQNNVTNTNSHNNTY